MSETDKPLSKVTQDIPKQNHSALGSIKKTETGFEVMVPGLVNYENESILGTTPKHVATEEEAKKVAETIPDIIKDFSEQASLRKSFGTHIFRINNLKNGKFRVVLPSAVDLNTGYYVGLMHKDFDTWSQAKACYLQTMENEEKLTHSPLLKIQISENENIFFSDFGDFDPQVTPSTQTHHIPVAIEKYLFRPQGKRAFRESVSAITYQNTIQEKGWETKLYHFITDYLQKGGTDIAKQLQIKYLDSLTPKQAIVLATQLVVDLTKYNDVVSQQNSEELLPAKPATTTADNNSVLQLLQEGLLNKNNPNWAGNGVCRNFASSVKAVFESLKANQSRFNRLRDTYCLYEGDTNTYAPERKSKNTYIIRGGAGHAWNTFVTVSRTGDANVTIVDATWATQDSTTKQVKNLDYTLTRMEPMVYTIAQEFDTNTPHKEEQFQNILSFYTLTINQLSHADSLKSQAKVKQFYTTRVVELMAVQGVPSELPESLVKVIEQEYLKMPEMDHQEIETIYQISQNYSELDFRNILKHYLKDKDLIDYHAHAFIFRDDNLQKAVFEEIKLNKNFTEFLNNSPKFRIRTREIFPQLLGDFSPITKPADTAELKFLLGNQRMLSRYNYLINPKTLSVEKLDLFFQEIRKFLKQANPQRYDTDYINLDNYALIKHFDEIYNQADKSASTQSNS